MPPSPAYVGAKLRAHEASEQLRKRAEGYGRPLITTELQGKRIVAVGKRVIYGEWRYFTDFLIEYAKEVMGRDWGAAFTRERRSHPFLTWLGLLKKESQKSKAAERPGTYVSNKSFAIAFFRFAYALYLIEHHSEMPKRLKRRLRDPETFRPAAAETLAFAAFALAGFDLEMGETEQQSDPEGEFVATFGKSGISYNVEVKRKEGWKCKTTDVESGEFAAELHQWLRQKLYAAARKKLPNPIYWLELSIPDLVEPESGVKLQSIVRDGIRAAEAELRVDGEIPGPAWIIVTVHGFLADDDAPGSYCAILEGFHLRMYESGEQVEIEEAFDARDRDRDIMWMLGCLEKVQHVPHSFDGLPDGLDRKVIAKADGLRIGEPAAVEMPDGRVIEGMVLDVITSGNEATAIIQSRTDGKSSIVTLPLTEAEQEAARQFGDAVFGKPDAVKKLPEDDPLAVYDWLLETYSQATREKLESFIEKHALADEFKKLDTPTLRRRVCREWTKSILAGASKQKKQEGLERRSPSSGAP